VLEIPVGRSLHSPWSGQVINNLTSFGVVTNGNRAYSIDAFKPIGIAGND